ncbi:MAG: bleomycin resistance family protein [Gammaproteobacteria bacterium]|nr:bleomycin resistance family protein [Gammaproteobacteria bacterium]
MSFPTNVEMIDPILCVSDLMRSITYYTEVLGFEAADWNTGDFTSVALAGNGIYLAQNAQGQPGTWIWVGVGNVRAVYELYQPRGAIIRMPPTKYPWALELQVEDPDGNVLRFGSDPDA